MAWDIRNLFRPVSPGLSGAANPLAFIGAGMAQGNPLGALQSMGQLQMTGQQNQLQQEMLRRDQQEAERKAKQRQALAAIAPGVAKELFPTQPSMQQMLAMNPALLQEAMKQRMRPSKPTSAMQNVMAYQTATPEQRAIMDKMGAFGGGAPGTVVNVGQTGQFGSIPVGMQRVESPGSPTGTTLIAEPGSPEAKKAKEASNKIETMQATLNRYRQTLDKYGAQILPGEGKDVLSAAHTDLLLQLKELNELGAITGPDYELMLRAVKDPTSVSSEMRQQFGGMSSFNAQLDLIQDKLDTARALTSGKAPAEEKREAATMENPASVADDTDYEALPSGSYYMGPDGVLRQK